MRSFISSSESVNEPAIPADPSSEAAGRLPKGGWGRAWFVALLLACCCLGGLETLLRERGRVPTIVADQNLWCLQRDLASGRGSDTVAILGTSRAQTGFDSRLFRREYPDFPLAMLTVGASHPPATMEDLANDSRFQGIVLCELFSFSLMPLNWDTQQSYVDYYHSRWRTDQRVERVLKSLAQESFVAVAPGWRRDLAQVPGSLLKYALGWRATPLPEWEAQPRIYFPDGSVAINYAVVNALAVQNVGLHNWETVSRESRPIDAEEWAKIVARFAAIIDKIQGRGGRVVLINYPVGGRLKEAMNSAFPRDKYWDVLARGTKAIAIAAEDVPSLSGYLPPDGLHLGREDAERFTASLLEELRRRQILPPLSRR